MAQFVEGQGGKRIFTLTKEVVLKILHYPVLEEATDIPQLTIAGLFNVLYSIAATTKLFIQPELLQRCCSNRMGNIYLPLSFIGNQRL
jgi:hypothetical protein